MRANTSRRRERKEAIVEPPRSRRHALLLTLLLTRFLSPSIEVLDRCANSSQVFRRWRGTRDFQFYEPAAQIDIGIRCAFQRIDDMMCLSISASLYTINPSIV